METPTESVDLALLCKLIPVIEAEKPGRGFGLANSLDADALVITFPLKSLSGKEKGMYGNYSATFEKSLSEGKLSNFRLINSGRIGNELVYVCKRH